MLDSIFYRNILAEAQSENSWIESKSTLTKQPLKGNKVNAEMLENDSVFNSPRYLKETKPRHMAMWSTLRTNKQTHKPNYVNQTGTIKHLFAFDKPRSNIWSSMRNTKGSKVEEKSVSLTNKSQDRWNPNDFKLNESCGIKRVNKRNCFSTQGSKRNLISPTTSIKEPSFNNNGRFMTQQRSKTTLQKKHNKTFDHLGSGNEIKLIIQQDDDLLWKNFDKENESLDETEFIRKCKINLKELNKDKPKSQYLTNKAIMENIIKLRSMLSDNKNIHFGNIRAKYFSKYNIKISDISRLQTLIFMKKRSSLNKERTAIEKEFNQQKQNLMRSLRSLKKETDKKLKSNNIQQKFKHSLRGRKIISNAETKYRSGCSC